jgi:hypothetical protein
MSGLKTAPERYFYHSFPQHKEKTGEVEKGLKILALMKKMGLLLTPDNIPWPDVRSDGSASEGWTITQIRCCFTELGPNELAQHAEEFGHFALEFEVDVLPRLGAIPVFYLPRRSIGGAEQLATELVACVGNMQILVNRILRLEEEIRVNSNKNKSHSIIKNGDTRKAQSSVGGAEDLLSSLTEGMQPLSRVYAALKALSGFFYPTDDLSRTGLLGYYRQREWRILANIGLTRRLEADERECLLQLDRQFFTRELKFENGIHPGIDECRVFQQLDGKPIICHARRIIVPLCAVREAEEILNGPDDPPVIALESIGSN